MLSIRKLLFPTDFSEPAAAAWEYALALAGKFDAEIELLHVVPELPRQAEPYYKMATEEAQRRMGHLIVKAYEYGVAMTPKVRYGAESREIVDEAGGAGADIIVMGTHGRTRLAHALIGASLTQKVARKAPCPVLTVKADSPMNFRTIRRWETPSETRTWVA
jgi:nucleotide-binding universal stress UspA family protein